MLRPPWTSGRRRGRRKARCPRHRTPGPCPREAAAALGVSERTIRRAIARGDLPATRHSGVYRIAPADLARYRARGRSPIPLPRRTVPDPPRPIPLPKRAGEVVPPLPQSLTALIGRETETAAVVDLLQRSGTRLVTLTAPGGVGKTRLALRVAEAVAPAWSGNVWFVPLAPVSTPKSVTAALAQALGVADTGRRGTMAMLAAFLRLRPTLQVLDNFEHLVDAAPLLSTLLTTCPNLSCLVTSRSPLRLSGEQGYVVSPLDLPDPSHGETADRLGSSPAVRLFVARARAARPDFTLTDDNAPTIGEICRRLDGLPLAIELAAARVRHLAPASLLARIEQGAPILGGGPRDAPARQRSLRDTIAWSYDLLTPAEQTLLRRLAVFAGGCTREAAEAVAGESAADLATTLDLVASLVEKSLLRLEAAPAGGGSQESRYGMLETIRVFAREQLDASGEAESIRRRHAEWCLALVEHCAEPIIWRRNVVEELNRVEVEHDNMLAALAWAEQAGEGNLGVALAAALWPYWYFRGHFAEGRTWLERTLRLSPDAPTPARAEALCGAGWIAHYQGDDAAAEPMLREALANARRFGRHQTEAMVLYMFGTIDEDRGAYAEAVPRFEHSRSLFDALNNHGFVALCRYHLGILAYARDDDRLAINLLERAAAELEASHDRWGVAVVLDYLGYVLADRGDTSRAATCFATTLPLHQEVGSGEIFGSWLSGVATLAAKRGDAERAARLFAAAAAVNQAVGYAPSLPESALFARVFASTRATLGEQRFAEASRLGGSLSSDQAIALAQEVLASPGESRGVAASSSVRSDHGLSARELEVLRLLVAGRSDREIGDALFISPRTASKHVANILAKLGVSSRSEAAIYALRAGLV